MNKLSITLVVGARPNFMKMAPIIRELEKLDKIFNYRLIHTGQHRSIKMNEVFFNELGMPPPHLYLKSKGETSVEKIAGIMEEFEKECLNNFPDIVLVVGDVNSTLACSIVSKKLNIKLVHIEAGLRSGDSQMPEEINRIITDSISDLFFVTEPSGVDNLINEGHNLNRIHYVGNVMIDNLFYQKEKLDNSRDIYFSTSKLKNKLKKYAVVTLHRPSNVDNIDVFSGIIQAINQISLSLPVIFPVHPRTRKNINKFNIKFNDNIFLIEPLSYLEFLNLWKDAEIVLTDSGGLQEETTALSVPCNTIRNNTERPITVSEGTNTVVGTDPTNILNAFKETINKKRLKVTSIKFWDGDAAARIVEQLKNFNYE